MLGNFSYYNPTKLYFGDESLNYLKDELKGYGPVVLLNYGSGSVKRNGIYDQVVAILKEAGKTIVENPGVMTNPTLEKLREGVKIARENEVDLILALGGGSVCDYSKAVAASVYYEGDYWDQFWLKQQNPAEDQRLLPVGCILTMAGTGSEMNAGTVITDAEHTFKVGHVFDSRLMPKFSILNPKFTMTVPENQMKAGIYDIMNHIMEQYFSDFDDNTSDYLSEGLMRSVISGLRGTLEHHVDRHMGTEHPHRTGQAAGLDGSHDWPQRRCLDARPSRLCAGLRLDGLLSPRHAEWSAQVCTLCQERVEYPEQWNDRRADSRSRSAGPESLDAGDWSAPDHQRDWCH